MLCRLSGAYHSADAVFRRRFGSRICHHYRSVDALIGEVALVTEEISNICERGEVKLHGLRWPARAKDPDRIIPVGTQVEVLDTTGEWSHVRLSDGNKGYMLTKFLKPQSGTQTNPGADSDNTSGSTGTSSGVGATVISTNLSVKELRDRYTERIASRLTDKRQCTQVVFMGEDIRRV